MNQQVINPLISIIIPVFNGERYIANAIQSILAQNYHPIEIIVVDDGSNDKTAEILGGFGEQIKYLHQENSGPPCARNYGIKNARGDFIAFLDHDDIFLNNALALHLHCMNKHKNPGVSLGYSQVNKLSADSDIVETKTVPQLLLQCALFKKSVFDTVGMFDETLFLGDDLDFFLRIREAKIPFAIHSNVVTIYNRHETNVTNNIKLRQLYLLKVIKKAWEHRKNLGEDHPNEPEIANVKEALSLWHTALLK